MPNLSYVEMYSSGFDRKNVDYCYNSERTYYKNRMILMSIAFLIILIFSDLPKLAIIDGYYLGYLKVESMEFINVE